MGNTARQLVIDVEFQDLIPPLTPEEREGLEADILRDGCLTPLLVWRGESGDVLLDGHNRKAVCDAHDFPYETESVPGIESREDAKRWIIDHQRHRRNLNEAQRAMLGGLLASLSHGQRKSDAQICASHSQPEAAKEFNVSRRSVQHARKIHEKGVPELARLVTEGKASVSAAADVASLPAHEQREIVADGPDAIQAAAKKLHRKKAADPTTPEPSTPAESPSAPIALPTADTPAIPPVQPEPVAAVEESQPSRGPLSPEGLRPCSHCGGVGTVKKEFDILRGNLTFAICQNDACSMQTPFRKKPEDVIEIWNRRPSRS